jgi:hypothetical protein
MTAAALLALLALHDAATSAAAAGADAGAAVAVIAPASMAAPAATPSDGGTVARSLNLLVGLPPPATVKVTDVERMTDGRAPEPGDNWESQYTSKIPPDGSVTWDFGVPTDFDGAWIQADNNDVYILATSNDGVNFYPVWEAITFDMAPGMQARWSTSPLHANGRFLRLTARGGDNMYSVGEIAVFKDFASAKPYLPSYVKTVVQPPPPCDGNWAVIAIVLFGAIYLVRRLKPVEAKPEAPPAAASTEGTDKAK